MFKSASDNAQARDRRIALAGDRERPSIDFEKKASDLENERKALIAEKVDIDLWLQKIKNDKAKLKAGLGYSRARASINPNTLIKWENERGSKIKRLATVNKRLAEIKREREDLNVSSRSRLSYTDAFFRCAKDILPSEVMDRINSAAIVVLAHVNDGPEEPTSVSAARKAGA